MEDKDLIARVYAYPDEYIHNALAAITATGQSIAPEPPESPEPDEIDQSRSHRESTEPPIEPDTDWRDKYPFLELRFSHGARLPMGLVFGTDKGTCDIVLPHKGGISRRHFALTYKRCKDTYYHLVVRDLNSTSGTEVDYNGKGLGVRKNFDWIMHGYQFPDQARKIAIKLSTALKFIIIVPRHDITSSTYAANVERFLQGSAAPEDLVGTLGIYTGLQTEQDTLAHTPTTGPIIIPYKELGGGGFGLVSRCWNVSTGDEWACKQPRQANLDQRELQEWAKEIEIMKTISHEHIVRFHAGYLEPNPIIYMEYVPLGNLQDAYQQSPFSIPEVFEILHQSASALAYLHERSDPICHRDIKPENILVQSRHPLYIKLSDFGLSKAGDLKTMCGTQNYMAPEVVASCGVYAYTTAADIWSLGVIILQFTYGLPFRQPTTDLFEWCTMLQDHLFMIMTYWPDDLLPRIMKGMIEMVASSRDRAAYFADRRLSLGGLPVVPMPVLAGNIHDPPQETARPPQEIARPPQEIAPPLQEILPQGEYLFLDIRGFKIAYHPSAKIMNASHLMKLKQSKYRFRRFFELHHDIVKYVRTTGGTVRGTYISFQDVEQFCNYMEIDYGPIRQIILASIAESSHNEDDLTIRAPDNNGSGQGTVVDGNSSAHLSRPGNQSDSRRDLSGEIDEPAVANRISSDNIDNSAHYRLDANSVRHIPRNDSPHETEHIQHTAAEGSRSVYTELSYSNGAYLLPPNQSYKELLNRQ